MLNTIYSHHKLSDEVKTRIGAHQSELKRKKLTKAREEKEDRIVQKVIVDEKKTKQVDVFTEFLTNFIKPEVLFERYSIRKLKTIDFSSAENHLLDNLLSVGLITHKIIKISRKDGKTVPSFKQSNNCLFKVCFLFGWKITTEQ